MNTIKFKIKGYEEQSGSIIVSFSSDETETNNPENYPEFAMQPVREYPDITDIEVLKKKIAEQGIGLAQQAKLDEQAKSNTEMQNKWKALVGQTFEYNVADLYAPQIEATYMNEVVVPPVAE